LLVFTVDLANAAPLKAEACAKSPVTSSDSTTPAKTGTIAQSYALHIQFVQFEKNLPPKTAVNSKVASTECRRDIKSLKMLHLPGMNAALSRKPNRIDNQNKRWMISSISTLRDEPLLIAATVAILSLRTKIY
jgi:hypothetical protein